MAVSIDFISRSAASIGVNFFRDKIDVYRCFLSKVRPDYVVVKKLYCIFVVSTLFHEDLYHLVDIVYGHHVGAVGAANQGFIKSVRSKTLLFFETSTNAPYPLKYSFRDFYIQDVFRTNSEILDIVNSYLVVSVLLNTHDIVRIHPKLFKPRSIESNASFAYW